MGHHDGGWHQWPGGTHHWYRNPERQTYAACGKGPNRPRTYTSTVPGHHVCSACLKQYQRRHTTPQR